MNLPEIFQEQMKNVLGIEYDYFRNSLEKPSIHSIRINPKKWNNRVEHEQIAYCKTGFYLEKRPLYTLDPFFHSGVYYAQESSSMFLEQIIKNLPVKTSVRVLDLCGSPGGKSTHLSSILSEDALLVSNDVIHSRASILSENLKKWGNMNIVVTNNDPKDFSRLGEFFDIIIVDAPCSGEGLFRRDEGAITEWSMANRSHCAQRQKRILADIWPSLKKGGYLIYSTCTYNPNENEENIEWLNHFAKLEHFTLPSANFQGIRVSKPAGFPAYQFYPHLTKGEGFFITAVQKEGFLKDEISFKSKDPFTSVSKREKEMTMHLMKGEFIRIKWEDNFLAFPSNRLIDIGLIKNNLRIVHAGIKMGEIKNNDFIPSHDLSLSTNLSVDAFPKIELTLDQALSYLHKDEVFIPSQQLGWNLVTYRKIPLGWIKNIGNRFNNGYPKEWRIRMSIDGFKGEKLDEVQQSFPL